MRLDGDPVAPILQVRPSYTERKGIGGSSRKTKLVIRRVRQEEKGDSEEEGEDRKQETDHTQ